MLGGNLPALCSPLGSFLNQPKLRVLATSGARRSRFMPHVPTLAEQGFSDMVYSEWYGFFVPAKTPAERVRALSAALREAITSPDVVAALATFGMDAAPSTPEELARALADDTRRWGAIVKAIGFTAES
jgi:tripartite-type tricarboxylate transporter receptor subunit TctC